LVTFGGLSGGFAPRHLNRCVASFWLTNMRSIYCSIIFLIIFLVLSGCDVPSASTQSNPSILQPSPSATPYDELPEMAENFYVEADSLIYAGFELKKHHKKVKLEDTSDLTEVSYAVLQKNGRTIATFDGVYFGAGNATDFGLISFLGTDTKQFIISQTIPRSGRHWVVSVSPEYRILFDSREFGVGREEVIVADIDGDGVREISMALTAFYGFENLSTAETPLPEIIFRYDKRERKYLPANQILQNYSLRGIKRDIAELPHLNGESHFPQVLDITLRLIFAGKEQEAWAFFDKEYKMENRNKLKAKILTVLKEEPVYKFIYK
jgi:hypothetical protein